MRLALAPLRACAAFVLFERSCCAPERLLDRRGSTRRSDIAKPTLLLRESAQRQRMRARLAAAEAQLTSALTRVEASGGAVWFNGQLYREKMRKDRAWTAEPAAEDAARSPHASP